MKQLTTILLIATLYSAQFTQWLSYGICLAESSSVNSSITCDCQLNKQPLANGIDTKNQTHKHEHQLKGDWNFTQSHTSSIQFHQADFSNTNLFYYLQQHIPSNWIKEIFHPPSC